MDSMFQVQAGRWVSVLGACGTVLLISSIFSVYWAATPLGEGMWMRREEMEVLKEGTRKGRNSFLGEWESDWTGEARTAWRNQAQDGESWTEPGFHRVSTRGGRARQPGCIISMTDYGI